MVGGFLEPAQKQTAKSRFQPASFRHGDSSPSSISMKPIIKIPRGLYEQAKADLLRPHEFAWERVGFFSTLYGKTKSRTIVHCVAYHPVQDGHYIEIGRASRRERV